MKKIFIKGVILSAVGMLLLGGCSLKSDEAVVYESRAGQEAVEGRTSEQEIFEQEISEREISEQEISEQETSEQESTEQESSGLAENGVPTIKIIQETREWYSDDGAKRIYETKASRVEVISEGFDALRTTLAGQWRGLDDSIPEYLDNLDMAKEIYALGDWDYPTWYNNKYVEICRLDNHVVSLWDGFGDYLGGSHGRYGGIGRTYDVRSGKELQLEDILTDSQGFYDKAVEYIIARLGEEEVYKKNLYQNYAETVRTDTFGETPASWNLDRKGIVIDYQLYQIGPYAVGMPSVTLPYDEFAAYIKEDYWVPCDSFVTGFEENEDISGLIGETGEVKLVVHYNGRENPVDDVSVVSGNASETVGIFERVLWEPYVIKRADGRSFLIFSCDYATDVYDDYVTYVYEVTGGAVRFCDKLDGVWVVGYACAGTDRIGLSVDPVWDYKDMTVYQLTEDGKLVQDVSEPESTQQIFGQTTKEQEFVKMADDKVPTIKITRDRKKWYSDDGKVLLLTAEAGRVEVVSEGFAALRAALAGQWKGLGDYGQEELEWARERYGYVETGGYNYFFSDSLLKSVTVYRMDSHVVSLCDSYYEHTGRIRIVDGHSGRTYDVKSGRELRFEDILSDPDGFYDKAPAYIRARLEEKYKELLMPGYEKEVPVSWYLDSTGIVVEYAEGSVAYGGGMLSVTLPYDVFAEYIKEEYLMPRGSFVVKVEENEDISGLIGVTGKAMLMTEYTNAYEYSAREVTVVSGDRSEAVGTFSQAGDAYVVRRADGRSFLIFDCIYYPWDNSVTFVYELTDNALRRCDRLEGASWSGRPGRLSWSNRCIGMDRIGLSVRLDVLGTYDGGMIYQLTDDGKLVQAEEIFVIDALTRLSVIKALPVTINGQAAVLPAGTNIVITGTDNAGKAYFQVDADNGAAGVIDYTRDTKAGQLLIGGVPDYKYFEQMPYEE